MVERKAGEENVRGDEISEQTDIREVEQISAHSGEILREEVAVDRAGRVVRNVALVGAVSRNGYRYSEDALRQAVALYPHKPVFLDHGAAAGRPQERSTRDLVGSIVEARYESGRVRGDIHVLGTEAGETFLALVESDAPAVGMSHVVRVERGSDPKVIESIQDVISVDAVVYPATTTTFRESVHETETSAVLELNEQIQELRQRLTLVEEERDRLQGIVRELSSTRETRQAESEVEVLLRRSGLPGYAVTGVLREILTEQKNPQERKRVIDDRWEVVRQAKRGVPCSLERGSRERRDDDRWIVEVLTGRAARES